MIWVWIIGIVVLLAAVLYWIDREVYFYEGVRLGPRIQGWLYDQWAGKYDQGKTESQKHDRETLARPLLDDLKDVPAPFVLDVATGTGRFPYALLSEAGFNGHIIALDISKGMLDLAVKKNADFTGRVTFIQYTTWPLPFPDNTFDVVSCMEALEVMSEMEAPLAELYRVLRPGGYLMSSRGTEESGRKNKVRSVENFTQLLNSTGFEQVEIHRWWKLFDRVRARKPGQFTPAGEQSISSALCCPKCAQTRLEPAQTQYKCANCGTKIATSPEGIILHS